VNLFYGKERSDALAVVPKRSVEQQADGKSCGVHMIANTLEATGLWTRENHRFAQRPANIAQLRHFLGHFLLAFSVWTARVKCSDLYYID
jgi:hypothetical protein